MHNHDAQLRIPSKNRGQQVSIRVDGLDIAAFEGETIHAVMIAAGIQNFRESSGSGPRGVFCGMGICYDCLVRVNGKDNQRACMTQVEDGMEIDTRSEDPK
ncbi:MAG: (2Fe-2S)-binding protein [Desulfobacterales bacterium]|nr:(2Fe-2S)-binding protein [Desulfobacterales bacterium]